MHISLALYFIFSCQTAGSGLDNGLVIPVLHFSPGLCFLYERPLSSSNNLNCRLKLGNSKAPSAWRKLYRQNRMGCLERDAKIGEKNEKISSENSFGRTISKTLDFPSVDHLNPLVIQKESQLLAPSLQLQGCGFRSRLFICFLCM